jgi:hypothetical protein
MKWLTFFLSIVDSKLEKKNPEDLNIKYVQKVTMVADGLIN